MPAANKITQIKDAHPLTEDEKSNIFLRIIANAPINERPHIATPQKELNAKGAVEKAIIHSKDYLNNPQKSHSQ